MNNGEYEYGQMLKNLANEIRNLKTAHQRPLGTLNFFKKNISFNVELNYEYGSYYREFNVKVKIALPITTPPILQPFWNTPPGFYVVWLNKAEINLDYTEYSYRMYLLSDSISSGEIVFGAISSQPIENISWSYV